MVPTLSSLNINSSFLDTIDDMKSKSGSLVGPFQSEASHHGRCIHLHICRYSRYCVGTQQGVDISLPQRSGTTTTWYIMETCMFCSLLSFLAPIFSPFSTKTKIRRHENLVSSLILIHFHLLPPLIQEGFGLKF